MSLIINSYNFGGAYTARTAAFLAATGISDVTIANALNTMDLALIANGLDTKMNALYPFVGGTASTHKWNFMNAVDSDAAFRLTFSGGWTHSSTGALPNGSTGFANTHFNPVSVGLSLNSNHLSHYSRTNNTYSAVDIGASSNPWDIEIWYLGVSYAGMNTGGYMSGAIVGTQGLFLNSRTASNSTAYYKNATSITTSTTVSTAFPNLKIYIGARNDGVGYYSNRECAFATIGSGLSSTDSTNFYNIVQTFQTSLSRNV